RRLQARRPAVPALRDADPLARAGRRQPHGVLVPGLPKRRGVTGRVEAIRGRARSPPVPLTPPVLPGGLLIAARRRGGRRRAALRVRGARLARAELALRVPAARSLVRRGARRAVERARRCPTRDRGSRARAGRRDLRRGALRQGGRPAAPADDRAAAARRRRRGLWRVRLERRGLRPRLRGARALAVRLTADVRGDRAARRALARRPGRVGPWAANPRRRRGRAGGALARGERPPAGRV